MTPDGKRERRVRCPSQARVWLEHQPHVEQVPQLAVGSPDVLGVQPLFNEAELSIEGNRSLVVREDAQCQLVQTARFSPLDRGGHQFRPYSASAPLWGDEHPDLPNPKPLSTMKMLPTTSPAATATKVRSQSTFAARFSTLTGGSAAIPSRSLATPAKS